MLLRTARRVTTQKPAWHQMTRVEIETTLRARVDLYLRAHEAMQSDAKERIAPELERALQDFSRFLFEGVLPAR